jgi:hypothetical protein
MNNNETYKKLKINTLFKLSEKVNTSFPNPNASDYSRGYISRYFVQKTNDKGAEIYEVNYSEYSRLLSNNLFTKASIKWRISGPSQPQYNEKGDITDKGVKESNRLAIQLVFNKIPNLKVYLPNLLQFYKN